jgi:hypothetical protein
MADSDETWSDDGLGINDRGWRATSESGIERHDTMRWER